MLAFILYIFSFLLTSFKEGVVFEQASKAAWNVAYVLLPILTAFGSFWFKSSGNTDHEEPDQLIDGTRVYALFALTSLFHIILLGYFSFGVFFVDFYFEKAGVSYSDRVDAGMKWLLLLSSLAVIPVGYLLGDHAPKKLDFSPNVDSQK